MRASDTLQSMGEALDRPEIIHRLFYPRPDPERPLPTDTHEFPVFPEKDVCVHVRTYSRGRGRAEILFFHGNGEIAADYDDIGPIFLEHGIHFSVAEYRGYGKSTGRPTPRFLLEDAYPVFDEWVRQVRRRDTDVPLFVMGRSLGSAPAIDLACHRSGELRGLIVESGFAHTLLLLRLLGLNPASYSLTEAQGFRNREKMSRVRIPTLVIHGQEDLLIPPEEARTLISACAAEQKTLHIIAGAGHNDLIYNAAEVYFSAVLDFVSDCTEPLSADTGA